MAKEWFQHDYGTRNKKKLAVLIHEEGCRGYGLFWIIVEMLYEDSDKKMELETSSYLAIKKESGESIEYIIEFIRRGLEVYKVFKKVGKSHFSTERVLANDKHRKEISEKNSSNGRKGGLSKSNSLAVAKRSLSESKQTATTFVAEESRVEEIREDKSKVEESTEESFAPQLFYDAEELILKNQIEFEKICAGPGNSSTIEQAKESLKKYHLYCEEKLKYPMSKKQIWAGFQRWLLNEKNFSNGTHQQSTGTSNPKPSGGKSAGAVELANRLQEKLRQAGSG